MPAIKQTCDCLACSCWSRSGVPLAVCASVYKAKFERNFGQSSLLLLMDRLNLPRCTSSIWHPPSNSPQIADIWVAEQAEKVNCDLPGHNLSLVSIDFGYRGHQNCGRGYMKFFLLSVLWAYPVRFQTHKTCCFFSPYAFSVFYFCI